MMEITGKNMLVHTGVSECSSRRAVTSRDVFCGLNERDDIMQRRNGRCLLYFVIENLQSILRLRCYRSFPPIPARKAKSSGHRHSFVIWNQIAYFDFP